MTSSRSVKSCDRTDSIHRSTTPRPFRTASPIESAGGSPLTGVNLSLGVASPRATRLISRPRHDPQNSWADGSHLWMILPTTVLQAHTLGVVPETSECSPGAARSRSRPGRRMWMVQPRARRRSRWLELVAATVVSGAASGRGALPPLGRRGDGHLRPGAAEPDHVGHGEQPRVHQPEHGRQPDRRLCGLEQHRIGIPVRHAGQQLRTRWRRRRPGAETTPGARRCSTPGTSRAAPTRSLRPSGRR